MDFVVEYLCEDVPIANFFNVMSRKIFVFNWNI